MMPIDNYIDYLMVQTLLEEQSLIKISQTASLMSGFIDKIKTYINNNIDPNDKAGSILDMLAPGLISTTFSLMGLGKIGLVLGLLARMFHFDLAGILRDIWSSLKEELSDGKTTTSEQVNTIVQNAVQQNSSAPVPTATGSLSQQFRQAQLLRLGMERYPGQVMLSLAAVKPSPTLLAQILSFILRVILSAAGLMVAGDLMNHFLNRPNALDNPMPMGHPVGPAPDSLPTPPVQSLFPLNPSYQDTSRNTANSSWIENTNNDPSSISQMLLNFTKDVYQGLQGHDSLIQSDPYFQNLVETISWYNHESPNSPSVFIPRMFVTKKQLVDQFIGDVAQKLPVPVKPDTKTASLQSSFSVRNF
jgi:hypothetical protein